MPVFPVRKAMERMPAAGGGGTDIRRRARDTADRSLLASSTSDRRLILAACSSGCGIGDTVKSKSRHVRMSESRGPRWMLQSSKTPKMPTGTIAG
jgi:hypothetical protein